MCFEMIISGIIVSGTRKGSYFVSQKVYSDQFIHILGFKPFPGTLNIEVNEKDLQEIVNISKQKLNIIHGQEGFGDVKYIKSTLNNKIDGALLFPVKTEHPPKILEFIANENLREDLNLKDGDLVTLILKY
jgi:riboflavin kinase